MSQVVIENPILNSPFEEPRRHFKFTEDGITDEVVEQRRPSSYFIPIPRPRKQTKQLTFDSYWEEPRQNDDINYIRDRVGLWRQRDYPGVTPATRALLDHWRRPDCERRLFFCQVEALETLIYLNEAAEKSGDTDPLGRLRRYAEDAGTPSSAWPARWRPGRGRRS